MAIFTEIIFFFISYMMYVFTDFVPDIKVKADVAILVICLTVLVVVTLLVAA